MYAVQRSCRAAQLRADRRHGTLHQAYEEGRIVETLMAFFLRWLAEERQARLELFIWGCISSRRNARKVPLCHRGLTVKNARARGALRGRGRAQDTQTHVPMCLKS